jgi:hypothetical protein
MSLAVDRVKAPERGLARRALRAGFGLWSAHFLRLAATAAVVWVPVYVIQLLLALALDLPGKSQVVAAAARGGGDTSGLTGASAALAAYAVLSVLLLIAALPLSHGALIATAGCYERGAPCRLVDCYKLAAERFSAFLGAIVVLALLILLGEAGLLIIGLLLMALTSGNVAMLTLMLLAGTLLPLLLAVPFSVAPQAVVLEHTSAVDGLQRSRALLAGRYLPVLGLLVVLGVLGWAAGTISGIPVRFAGVAGPAAQLAAGQVMAMVTAVVMAPLVVSVLTALYFEARR